MLQKIVKFANSCSSLSVRESLEDPSPGFYTFLSVQRLTT